MENKDISPTHESILNLIQREIQKNTNIEKKREFDFLAKIVELEEQQKNIFKEISYTRQDFLTNQSSIDENFQLIQSQSKNLLEGMNKYLTSTTDEMNKRFESTIQEMNKRFESTIQEMNKRYEKILESNGTVQNQIAKQFENAQIQLDEKISEINKHNENSIEQINSFGKTLIWLSVIGFTLVGGVIAALKFLF